MGCSNCISGSGTPPGCKNNGNCATGGCSKMAVFDWLSGMSLPDGQKQFSYAEVRFKSNRKDFYNNVDSLEIQPGSVVAVETSSGHDIGVVTSIGELARLQMGKYKVDRNDTRKIYRLAKQSDIDQWKEARGLEKETMVRARKLASELKLEMKIGDVEYQGDKTKATFYYTADARVDFRELIKKLAEEFRVRIEMRQIGARQEAGRIGGIGSCGRELCCSTWLSDFRSVSTSAARYQQLSLNPQKLAGQCGKLKCCLNYELDSYLDAVKDFPSPDIKLLTKKGSARHQKTDIFKRQMWYTYIDEPSKFIELKVDRVKEVIAMNENGNQPEDLIVFEDIKIEQKPDYENVVGQDSLTRFDKKGGKKSKKRRNKKHRGNKKK